MRWLLVLLVACGGAPPRKTTPSPPTAEQLDFYRARTIDALDAFVQKHPDSKYRNDALLQLADLHFEQAEVETALGLYQMTQFPVDDDRGWYVRYRIAWCRLNLGDRAGAIDEMTAVSRAAQTGSHPRAQLIEEAKKDLATWQDNDPTYLEADQLYAKHQFCEAAPKFAEVAHGTTSAREEAAYAHVLATISCEKLDDAKPDASDAWQHVLAAIDVYMTAVKYPMPAVQFRRGQILYATGRFIEAAADFRAIVDGASTDETAPYAAVLLLDSDAQGHADASADLARACKIHSELLDRVCQPAAPTTSSRR